jgi:hypothetical protein
LGKHVLLCLSHSIEEWQQLTLLTDLGYEVFSIGGYIEPSKPHDLKRPPADGVPFFPDLKAAVDAIGSDDNLGEAQKRIPDAVLDWLGDDGIIIYHHRLERLFGQWPRVKDWMKGGQGRRVIWRSVGQSVKNNEREAAPFRVSGLERVAYSPREVNIPEYSGHDAIIRFWGEQVDEDWVGDDPVVIQVSQHLRQRDPFTNWEFWDTATRDLPRLPVGPGSEVIGGAGQVSYEAMREYLLHSRAFLWTGSQPASYTLGLIEAMHHGIPTVSIGPSWMRIDYDGHTSAEMFEGHEIALKASDDPNEVRHILRHLLEDHELAHVASAKTRARARELFDRETVGKQWAEFLG